MAAGAEEPLARLPKLLPQSLTASGQSGIFKQLHPVNHDTERSVNLCLFWIFGTGSTFRDRIFILSLSRECDFPVVIYSSFGMKAEQFDSME
jgi:hypothetical protein